jgi:dipeptidyl aminopeptidase/acylaminoacyl peptidase
VRISNGIPALLVLCHIVLAAALASAEEPGALKIDDLLAAREFGQLTVPALSPDQEWLIYAVHDGTARAETSAAGTAPESIPWYAKGLDLYAVNTRTGKTQRVTEGVGDNWGPSWSPDGRQLAFLSDRDGSGVAKLWVWRRATGELAKISDVCVRENEVQWIGNQAVLVTVFPESSGPGHSAGGSTPPVNATADGDKSGSTVEVYSSHPTALAVADPHNVEPWNLDAYLSDLAVIDIGTGAVRRLTRNQRVGKYIVSPDYSHVAFSSPVRFEEMGSQQIVWNLSVVSLATSETRILASGIRLEYDGSPFSWSPEGSRLAYLAGGPLERAARGDCYVIDLKSGTSTNVSVFTTPPSDEKQLAPLWGVGGRSLYFIRYGAVWKAEDGARAQEFSRITSRRVVQLIGENHSRLWSPGGGATVVLTYDSAAKQSGFYRVDLGNGASTRLAEDGRCYTCINADDYVYTAPGGNILVHFAEDSGHTSDLWMVDANSGSSRSLTHLNPQLDKCEMGRAQLVQWHDLDGRALEGALLLPTGYKKGTRYPLIVWVYGGDHGSDFLNHFGFSPEGAFNLQVLATRGYAVLFPDAPQNVTTPMFDLAKSVLPGINQLIEAGIADPDRLGVAGHSHGGYTTLALIVQTKRFKAAVEMDGNGSLLSAYGGMDKDGTAFGVSQAEQGQELMGGTPWQFRDRYIENSPYFYLDRVESPLLIVQGAEDTTTPPFLADELYVALRRLGKEVAYAKYEREGHSPLYWSSPNRIDLYRRILSWFDEHLRDSRN